MKYYIGLHYANDKHFHAAYMILHNVSTAIEEAIEFA